MSATARPISFTVGALRGRRRIQSVIFTRKHWIRPDAVEWLRRHGFKASPLATLRGSFRASQHPAGSFTRLRTIHTSGHPRPVSNPRPGDVESELTRDPREQGFLDAKAGKTSTPPPWYNATQRGLYAEGYIAGGQGRKGRAVTPARLKPPARPNPLPTSVRKLLQRHRAVALLRDDRGMYTIWRSDVPGARRYQVSTAAGARARIRSLAAAGGERTRLNPRKLVVPRREYHQAIELYQKFREAAPKRIATMRVEMPRVLVRVGPVPWLYYLTTHKGGKEILYKHTFARHARPILAASHNGRALYLLGGEYDFTRDGIVDRAR